MNKRWKSLCLAAAALWVAPLGAQENKVSLDEKTGVLHLPASLVERKVPHFFVTEASNTMWISEQSVSHKVVIDFKSLQGKVKKYSLKVNRKMTGVKISGEDVASWAIRIDQASGQRYLDVFIKDPAKMSSRVTVELTEKREELNPIVSSISFAPVAKLSSGFVESLKVMNQSGTVVEISELKGYQALKHDEGKQVQKFVSYTGGSIAFTNLSEAMTREPIHVSNLQATATVQSDAKSALVELSGSLVTEREQGGGIDLISGRVALREYPNVEGLKVIHRKDTDGKHYYRLESERKGRIYFNLSFMVAIEEISGWKQMGFTVKSSAITPVRIKQLKTAIGGNKLVFDQNKPLVPYKAQLGGGYSGFIPFDGNCEFAWKAASENQSSQSFITTRSTADVVVGGGMVHQTFVISTKVLQGKISKLLLIKQGQGDIVELRGSQVSHWAINEDGNVEVILTGSYDQVGSLLIKTQQPLGAFPAEVEPVRLTPKASERHTGDVRVSNRGAVNVDVIDVKGMMQVNPSVFPLAKAGEKFHQVFAYKFPAKQRSWKLSAKQILSEVSVNQLLVYGIYASDRTLSADLNLDIREAPIREWTLLIPDKYAVSGVNGAAVSDYILSNEAKDGMRELKLLFRQPVIGRQLVQLKIEKNVSAEEGEWELPQLVYPGVKDVRGQIGVAAALGWKVATQKMEKLTELPLAYFQAKNKAVQQSYRQRNKDWKVTVSLEKLSQSVHADVFHLNTLKESMVDSSVILNYVVVGSPVNEWKLEVPEGAENITVIGQNVRSYSRKGNVLTVRSEHPAIGNVSLFIKYERSLSPEGGNLKLGQVTPLNVQSESGYVQVVSPSQVKHTSPSSNTGVLALEEAELPAEYRVLSILPTVAAWQYTARPFSLEMNVEWFNAVEQVDQSIDYATVNTSITKRGEVKNNAVFFVKTRGKKLLRMKLPEGAEFWGASANGLPVNVREDGEFLLLPLPAQEDLNTPVEVNVNYGMKVAQQGKVDLALPMFASPTVITKWNVKSLDNNLIIPSGGDVNTAANGIGENWFKWVSLRAKYLAGILILLVAGSFIMASKTTKWWKLVIGGAWLLLAMALSFKLAQEARLDVPVFDTAVELDAPMVEADTLVSVQIEQLTPAQAMVSGQGLVIALVGAALMISSLFVPVLRKFNAAAIGLVALAAGLLMQHQGAMLFFVLLAVLSLGLLIYYFKEKLLSFKPAGVAVLAALLALAPEADAELASIDEQWEIKQERLSATARMEWDAKLGETITVLQAPATLSGFDSLTCRVVKKRIKGVLSWVAVAESDGKHEISIRYKRPLLGLAGKKWNLSTSSAVVRKMQVTVDQPNWEVSSEFAIQTKHSQPAGTSVTELVLLPDARHLTIQPKKVDPDTKPLKFFAKVSDLYVPAPGVLDGIHEVSISPISGRLRDLKISIPADMMVGSVNGVEVDNWKFDPRKNQLLIQLKKPQSREFQFTLGTQRALTALPVKLEAEPIEVIGANRVIGMLALGFGGDAQPSGIETTEMNQANPDDFSKGLNLAAKKLHPGYSIHKAYRYGNPEAKVSLSVQPVEAEMRAETQQKLFIGEERFILNTSISVDVTRAGIFKLDLIVPEGFEVEAVNGTSLRNFTESDKDGKKILTLHLSGRKLGRLDYKIALTKAKPVGLTEWVVPQLILEGATRQSGSLVILPQQGIQVSTIERHQVTQRDAGEIRKRHRGALVFNILQKDAILKVGITTLESRMKAELLQEVTVREGQSRTRVGIIYNVSNAAVKELLIRIPNLKASEEGTVRVGGSFVKGITKVEGDLWKISLRRGMIGEFKLDIDFQTASDRKQGIEKVIPVRLEGVKQLKHFVAVRANERLDMQPVTKEKGWRNTDWKSIPKALYHVTNTAVPELAYQLMDGTNGLDIKVSRYAMADSLKLRVKNAEMMTLFSKSGDALNHLMLDVDVVEKSSMRISLPKGSKLFGVSINGDSVAVVEELDRSNKEGATSLRFNVSPGVSGSNEVMVQVVYSNASAGEAGKNTVLVAPRLDIPLESVSWKVILPKGVKLKKYGGDFNRVKDDHQQGDFDLSAYQTVVNSNKQEEQTRASEMMKNVDGFIKSGQRAKAQEILNQVYRNKAVGRDMNEDAHEMLTKNQWQHALMGLNTRRQRVYLDNMAEGNIAGNVALEEAASRNPLFKGNYGYDPNQVGDFMQGMTDEEKKTLEQIARLMVPTDANDVAAPQAIEVTMPELGTVVEFEREVQLSQGGDVTLELELGQASESNSGSLATVLGLLALASLLMFWRRK